MLQRLPIALPQVKAGNTSEKILNEMRQIIYYCIQKIKFLKLYNNKVIKQNGYYIYEFWEQ